MLGLVSGRVSPGVVLEMGERHVARAERIHLPQHAKAGTDRMAALHADQRGDLVRLPRRGDAGRINAELHIGRVARDQPLDNVDLLHRRLHRLRFAKVRRDVNRPQLRTELAFADALEVGHHRRLAARRISGVAGIVEVKAFEDVLAPVTQLFGHVIVPIPHRCGGERSHGNLLGRTGGSGRGGGDEQGGCGKQQGAHGVLLRMVRSASLSQEGQHGEGC